MSQNITVTEEDIQQVKDIIYRLENIWIQRKRFLDDQGIPSFITSQNIQNESSLSEDQVNQILRNLHRDEFMVFDDLQGLIVRSRTFHTIWCLFRTEYRQGERNVGDFKYFLHEKNIPERTHRLTEIYTDKENQNIAEILGGPHQLIIDIIKHIENSSHYNRISNFQKKCTVHTLEKLANKKNADALVFLAGTGFGKSFAYQLPLLLWILIKKINAHEKFLRDGTKLSVPCSALLIFPRVSLAHDQHKKLVELRELINNFIKGHPRITSSRYKEFLQIEPPMRDFSEGDSNPTSHYDEERDIIITTPQSLGNRLANPECHPVYRNGIDLILYDEVHTWEGIGGAEIAALNARLQNLFYLNKMSPLFIGMSATIANPSIHCKKLFALIKNKSNPDVIEEDPDEPMIPFTIEHHLMLKPAAGRNVPGVAMESTSCLLHNRRSTYDQNTGLRNGLRQWHDDLNNGASVNLEEKPKTISFINSLDVSGQYVEDLNDYEEYFGKGNAKFGGDTELAKPLQPNKKPTRQYFFYNKPKQGQSFNPATGDYDESCEDCQNKISPDLLDCEFYRRGQCWWYSEDDSNQFNTTRWQPFHEPTHGLPPTWIPLDNIRSKRASSKDFKPDIINDYFIDVRSFKDLVTDPNTGKRLWQNTGKIQIDHVVSTPTLEVGVDFDNIKEIIQIGSVLSASSYKQKAGRGAREGNMTDGLFAMSIINESPVSYFHFKHFERLITTSLDPLRLEIKNQNVVVGHCFLSIFDFFASKSINLFRLKPGADYLPTDEVVQQYSNALAELDKSEIKNFLTNFLDIMKADNKDAKVLIDYAKKFLKKLSERHDLTVAGQPENRTLHEWLVRAAVELPTFKQVQNSNFVPTAANEKLDADRTIKGELEKLDESFSKLYPQDDSLKKSIIKFREESK